MTRTSSFQACCPPSNRDFGRLPQGSQAGVRFWFPGWSFGLNSESLFSHSSRGWKSDVQMPEQPGYREGSVPGSQAATYSLCPHMGKESYDISCSYCNDTSSVSSTLMTSCNQNHLLKGPSTVT